MQQYCLSNNSITNCFRFGKYLLSQGVNPSSLHLIGHSLGSHISGYMSKNMADIAIPGRITGSLLYYKNSYLFIPAQKLKRNGAKLVNINDSRFLIQ